MTFSIPLTILDNTEGPLSKKIKLSADGEHLSSIAECKFYKGLASRWEFSSVAKVAATINRLKFNQAIALGSLRDDLRDVVNVVTGDELRSTPNPPDDLISKTRNFFCYRKDQPSLALLDYDPKQMPQDVIDRVEALGGFWAALCTIIPELAHTARITRASTSSGILRAKDNHPIRGSNGMHVYIVIKEGTDSARFLGALLQRCWIHGLAWGDVGEKGAFLERSIVDSSVGTPERLVFEGAPRLSADLIQPARLAVPVEGEVLDTRACCPALVAEELDQIIPYREAERTRLLPEINRRKVIATAEAAKKISEKTGRPLSECQADAEYAWTHNILYPDDVLPFDNARVTVTVRDVLDDPARFVDNTSMRMADPNEGPEYGPGKAIVRQRKKDGSLWIDSFAHGGTRYELREYPEVEERLRDERAQSDFTNVFEEQTGPADIEADVEAALAEKPIKQPRFRLISLDDLAAMPKPQWVVKDMIPEKGLVAVFGPPKSGKTFIVLSIALHVAAGRWWCGHEVTQGGVVYIAGEGQAGLWVRNAAMRQEYKLNSKLPFWALPQIVNFGNADQVDELAADIRNAVGGAPISLVVIDTLARAMPGADENSSTEMGKVIANCDRLKEILGCTVMPIHHEGKDGTRGMRGSNSLDGAVDAAFKVAWSKTESASILTLTTYYQKECEEAPPKFFDMTRVQVSEDIKSVVPILRTTPPPGKHDGITGHAGIAFSALEEALEDMGRELPVDDEKLPFARGVQEADWRRIFCSRLPGDAVDSKKKSFSRQVTALLEKKIIGAWNGWVWRTQDIHEFGVEAQPLDEREELDALMS